MANWWDDIPEAGATPAPIPVPATPAVTTAAATGQDWWADLPAVAGRKSEVEKGATGQQVLQGGIQGWTAGLQDEIAGAGLALRDKFMPWNYDFGEGGPGPAEQKSFSQDYEMHRDAEREKMAKFSAEHPGTAMASQMVGAALPAILTGGGAGAATGPQALMQAGKQAPNLLGRTLAATGGGALAGYGFSDAETAKGITGDTLVGGLVGAAAEPAMALLGAGGQKLYRMAKDSGAEVSEAVVRELKMLAEKSGKSLDEISEGLLDANPRVLADNPALSGFIGQIKNKGGEAGDYILDQATKRAGTTKKAATGAIRKALGAQDAPENILAARRATDQGLKALEDVEYNRVFGRGGERVLANPGAADAAVEVVQRQPELARKLNRAYQMEGKYVPLFKIDDAGAVTTARAPTLEDVDLIQRELGNLSGMAKRAGDATDEVLNAKNQSLVREWLDRAHPDLAQTRANAHKRRQLMDLFNEGREKSMTGKADDVLDRIRVITEMGDDDLVQAYRDGVAAAVDNRNLDALNSMAQFSDEGRRQGRVLDAAMVPGDDADAANRATQLASDALYNKNRIVNNSTTGAQLEASNYVADIGDMATDFVQAKAGNPNAVGRLLQSLVTRTAPKLNPQEASTVARYIYSTDHAKVMEALNRPEAMSELIELVTRAGSAVASRQGAAETTGLFE